MKASNGGFCYTLGSMSCWRKGSKEEVQKYIDKISNKYKKRNGTESHSWRTMTHLRFLSDHPDLVPYKKRG